MALIMKLVRICSIMFLILSISGICAIFGTYIYLAPGLPTASKIKDVQLQVPLRVYSQEGSLLAEYGEKRRKPLRLEEIPVAMQQAFLAAEDDRFFNHPGVDYQGLIRAAVHLLKTGEKGQGGSTITMQLTRNFFLSRERTYTRKLREIFLALKVERELSKQEILELYLNKIYLGHRAYGVGVAAEVYYGKGVSELNLAQIAMIAGLPKAPSRYNPIAAPDRSKVRRNYVLGRMHALGFIDKQSYIASTKSPVTAQPHKPVVELHAPYVGEMVRAAMVSRFGDDAYTKGLRVYTTVNTTLQRAAKKALRRGLLAYDKRHGYRGPLRHIDLELVTENVYWNQLLEQYPRIAAFKAGLVTHVDDKHAQVYLDDTQKVTLKWEHIAWARSYINENQQGPKPETAREVLHQGDIVYVAEVSPGVWSLEQVPEVTGATISLSPHDGAILALVGGFDFRLNKFNMATQAMRQPGSNFKPFIYSAALEKGYTPASIINDAPVVFNDVGLEDTWRPENYSGKFYGPTRMRVALAKSRNLVSIRLLHDIGTHHATNYISRFGFDREQLPNNLSLALGSSEVTPLQLASGYAIFANGGFRVTPYLISSVITTQGEILYESNPETVCEEPCQSATTGAAGITPPSKDAGSSHVGIPPPPNYAKRVISRPIAYQMVSMMQDVIRSGTGRKAKVLGRSDIAGKTGTTNDQHDAWFSGYNRDVVATVWVGFNKHKPLGNRETGAKAALPIWIDYMQVALSNKPEYKLKPPEDMVTVRIDPKTGLLASTDNPQAIFETFRLEYTPKGLTYDVGQRKSGTYAPSTNISEQLF